LKLRQLFSVLLGIALALSDRGPLHAAASQDETAGSSGTAGSAGSASSPVSDNPVDAIIGRVLPPPLAPESTHYFAVGVGVERFGSELPGSDTLVGLTAMLRLRAFGPHALVMLKPDVDGYEQTRLLAGLGLRGYVPLLGTEFSYGVGVHAEVRLEDHFWLAYATPLELGAIVYRKGTLDIELFVGARRAMGGALIDNFLIDPNGFDNENAEDELRKVRYDDPWRGFVRVVFAHRID
jgi:hypothetical protein